MAYIPEIATQDVNIEGPLSVFGEVLTAEITPVIQIQFAYNINDALVKSTTTGTGYKYHYDARAVIATDAATSSSSTIESIRHLKYRAGQGSVAIWSAIHATGTAGNEQLCGLGEASNGFYFGYNGTTFGILRISNGTKTWTTQASWNGDTMDGAGDSGMTLIPQKGNVYKIAYQWLGFGQIEHSILNPATGKFVVVHRTSYANANTDPSVFIPIFPVRFHIENTTNNTDLELHTSSLFAGIQGPIVYTGPRNSLDNTKSGITTTLTNILTIKSRATFNSIANHIPVLLSTLSVAVDGTKPVVIQLIKNTTLGGTPSYTNYSTNTSVIEYDTAGTTVTGGEVVGYYTVAKDGAIYVDYTSKDLSLQEGESLTIAAKATVATSDVTVSPIWIEDF